MRLKFKYVKREAVTGTLTILDKLFMPFRGKLVYQLVIALKFGKLWLNIYLILKFATNSCLVLLHP